MRVRAIALAVAVLPLLRGGAGAAEDRPRPATERIDLVCGAAENGAVQVDGLLDDWRGVEGAELGAGPLAAVVRCNVDDAGLYLAIDVRDRYLVRTAKATAGEDHVEVQVAGLTFQAFPVDGTQKERLVPPRQVRGAKMSSSLQPEGWAVELGIPVKAIPGYSRTTPQLDLSVTVYDCNSKAALKVEQRLAASGAIAFEAGQAARQALLQQLRARPEDVYFHGAIRQGRHGTAQVLLVGRNVAFVSDEYSYAGVPFGKGDLRDVRIVDLAGDGRDSLLVRYVEKGGGGAREVFAIYRVLGTGEVKRVFATETGKSLGPNRLETKVSLVARGRATDLVLEAQAATGWSADSYKEQQAEDMLPILLPWSDERRARYQFRGDEYLRAP